MRNKTVLVVAAHSDDEALGCGGTLARHVAEGDSVHAIFLADGVSSRPKTGKKDLAIRLKSAQIAHKILGLQSIQYLGLPDNRLDSLPFLDIVQPLEQLIQLIAPQIIYTHHLGDLNIDHRITHQAVLTACRLLPDSLLKEIYAFEVVSSTEWNSSGQSPFLPTVFVDISNYLDCKMEALKAYGLEMRNAPHARSLENIRALGVHRGHSVGVSAAEAFMPIRILR